jgi:hypothetical protein
VNGNPSGYATLSPSGTTDVSGGALAFALEPPANPAIGGRVSVSFTLAESDAARLELLDVNGRRVAARDVAGAGRHEVTLGEGQRVPPGVYFVRLTQGSRVARARLTVLE